MNIKKLISSFLLVFCFSGCANQKITQIESLEPGNLNGVNLFCEEQDLFVRIVFLIRIDMKLPIIFLFTLILGRAWAHMV
ncbi:MAG: hypothetical protein CM15mP93_05890 [Thiotrichaceae bacterium]|nr:MAG: hypothetical protein CM15mP93_05890 [Thiotrichaceae bacterium]